MTGHSRQIERFAKLCFQETNILAECQKELTQIDSQNGRHGEVVGRLPPPGPTFSFAMVPRPPQRRP